MSKRDIFCVLGILAILIGLSMGVSTYITGRLEGTIVNNEAIVTDSK